MHLSQQRLSKVQEGNVVSYEAFELEALTLAYAITIHKSQGSEFPAVIVPVLNSHHIMLQRNLLYTAITRARRLVVLVGDPKAIAVAVRNDKVLRRYTTLSMRLIRSTGSFPSVENAKETASRLDDEGCGDYDRRGAE